MSSTKNSLSIPFKDLSLGKPARSAKTGLRFSLKNQSNGSVPDGGWTKMLPGGEDPPRARVQDRRSPCPKGGGGAGETLFARTSLGAGGSGDGAVPSCPLPTE